MHWISCLCLFLLLQSALASAAPNDYLIQPVPFVNVNIAGGFWGPRLETNRKVTIPANFRKCEETGRQPWLTTTCCSTS